MARQKHFRLPDDVLEMINNRDKEMYPTENVYITEAVRNFLKKEETEPFIKCTHFSDLSEIKESYSRKNDCNSTEKSLKKSKVKNIDNILGFSPELEQAFQMYILVRSNNYGDIIPEQIQALREDLIQLSDSEVERIAIVKKATAGGWKSFYKTPCKEKQSRTKKAAVKDNNNFKRRQYDMDDLENRLLGR